jgi:hypothetical protein
LKDVIAMKAIRATILSAAAASLLFGMTVAQAQTGNNTPPAATPPAASPPAGGAVPSSGHKHKHHGKKKHGAPKSP